MRHKMKIKLVCQYLIMKRKANYKMNHQYHPAIYKFNQVLSQKLVIHQNNKHLNHLNHRAIEAIMVPILTNQTQTLYCVVPNVLETLLHI